MPERLNAVRTGPRGAGAPVVLLHSAGLDLTYWDAQIAELSSDHDVIAIDLPGHGASATSANFVTTDQVAGSVASAIAALDAGAVTLVGLSVGGLVAQHVALHAPELVGGLVLLDTAARFAPVGQAAMKDRATRVRQHGMAVILDELFDHWFLPRTRERRPDLMDRATKTLLRDDAGVHAAFWELIADFDVHARLGEITVPTLVLVGEHDSSSPISSARELRDGIRGAQLEVIRGAAHLSPIEQPAAVTGHLRAFLHSLMPGTTR